MRNFTIIWAKTTVLKVLRMSVNNAGYFTTNSVINDHFKKQSPRLGISVTKQHGDITQKLVIFVSNAGNTASLKYSLFLFKSRGNTHSKIQTISAFSIFRLAFEDSQSATPINCLSTIYNTWPVMTSFLWRLSGTVYKTCTNTLWQALIKLIQILRLSL